MGRLDAKTVSSVNEVRFRSLGMCSRHSSPSLTRAFQRVNGRRPRRRDPGHTALASIPKPLSACALVRIPVKLRPLGSWQGTAVAAPTYEESTPPEVVGYLASIGAVRPVRAWLQVQNNPEREDS